MLLLLTGTHQCLGLAILVSYKKTSMPWSRAWLQVAKITTLRVLHFHQGKALTDSATEVLSALVHLECLSLRGCDGVRGLHLTALRACRQLQVWRCLFFGSQIDLSGPPCTLHALGTL